MDEFIYDHPILATVLLLVVVLVFAFVSITILSDKSCADTAEIMQVDHKYNGWYGCVIEIEPDKWIPLDSYYYKEER